MSIYTASIQQSRQTIKRFSVLRYNIFQTKQKLAVMLLSAALIAFAMAVITTYPLGGAGLLFLACIVIANIDAPAEYAANRVAEMTGGRYPRLSYHFFDSGYRIADTKVSVSYRSLSCLAEDEDHLYLFQTPQYGNMLKKSTIQGADGVEGLKKMLGEKTGLKWKKELPVFTRRLTSAFSFRSFGGSPLQRR